MPTYAMLSTLGPGGWATLREHPERLREVTQEVESMGLTVVAQYALFGQWDFLNIIEAPDEATMAKAAVTLAARGTMRSTTLQALPIEDLLEALHARARVARASASHPPHVVLAALLAHLVVAEQRGQHRAVGAAPDPVAPALLRRRPAPRPRSPRAHAWSKRDRTSTRVPGSTRRS